MPDLEQRSPADLDSESQKNLTESAIANHMIDRHDTSVRLAAALLYSVGVCLILILIWAAFTKVPEVAVAPGQVTPRGQVKLIEPTADGVVEKVFVTEGQSVKAGDKLVLLDRIPYLAEVDKAQRDLEIANSKLKEHAKASQALQEIINDPSRMPNLQVDVSNVGQIISELYKAHLNLTEAQRDALGRGVLANASSKNDDDDGNANSDMSMISSRLRNAGAAKVNARQALEKRKGEFAERKKSLAIEANSLRQQIKSLKEQRPNLEMILAQTRAQANDMKVALEAGGLSRLQYMDALKAVEQADVALSAHNGQTDQLERRLEAAIAAQAEFDDKSRADLSQMQSTINQASSTVSEVAMQQRERTRNVSVSESNYYAALAKAKAALSQETDETENQESRIKQVKATLQAAQNSYDRAEISSPIAGIVTAIKLRGRGEVVSQKDVLMSVVPLVSDLVVEAQLPNKDRGFVHAGQPVKLKFASFPFQDFGILKGKLIEVESFPREINKLGGYYRIVVEPEQDYMLVHGQKLTFAPGMSVSAEVITNYRTVLNIMCEPIRKLQDARWN